jgi:hypothetical protein
MALSVTSSQRWSPTRFIAPAASKRAGRRVTMKVWIYDGRPHFNL